MDTKKDINKKDSIVRYVSNQTTRTNPFGENVSAERVYRRAERIASALHLLTNHLPEGEYLRIGVRERAVGLLAATLSMRDDLRAHDSRSVHEAHASIRLLISLVRMLAVSGHVSMQNADIVCEALDDLGVFLNAAGRTSLSENVRLSRDDFFDVRMNADHITNNERIVKDSIEKYDTAGVRDKKTDDVLLSMAPAVAVALDARQASILEVLRAGGQWGIRDIAAHLPEYSEKMIQRELADLVGARKVNKVGAKRWSKYALATV